jgi:hypothetical protein
MLQSNSLASPAKGARSYAWPGVATLATLVFQLWICGPLLADYFPTKDDIALEAISTPIGGPVAPSSWVIEGFHGMFATYPEWGTQNTDFWRPLANVCYWVHYQLFGTHWYSQLIIGYLLQALVVGATTYIALNVLLLPGLYAALAALIAVFSPALWSLYATDQSISSLVQYPVYQMEILCALLMLTGFIAFVREKYLLFALLLTAAVCLKETALAIPAAAFAVSVVWAVGGRRNSLFRIACALSPLIIWAAARVLFFKYGGTGNYEISTASPLSLLTQPLRNTLLWPSAAYVQSLLATKQAINAHAWGVLLQHGTELAVNLAWWVLIAFAAIVVLKAWRRGWSAFEADLLFPALVFALANLAFVIVLQQSTPRFGYLWFALGPAAVFAATRRFHLAGAATVLSLGLIAPQVLAVAEVRSSTAITDYRTIKQSARQLTELLGQMPPATTVYLVDDVLLKPAAPMYLQKLAGFRGRLVIVDAIDPIPGCTRSNRTWTTPKLTRSSTLTTLEYGTAPECFQVLWSDELPQKMTDGTSVPRGPWMRYNFPQLQIRVRSLLSQKKDYAFGDHWTVGVSDPACAAVRGCVWLGFDPARNRYSEIRPPADE